MKDMDRKNAIKIVMKRRMNNRTTVKLLMLNQPNAGRFAMIASNMNWPTISRIIAKKRTKVMFSVKPVAINLVFMLPRFSIVL